MTQDWIKELASTAPVYRFGSQELAELHKKNRGADGLYKIGTHEVYVVYFPACNGVAAFRTLNVISGGHVGPAIHDLTE